MKTRFNTVLHEAKVEIIEKKSRFIGYIKYIENEEQANEYIAKIKKKHWDASHNTYAYLITGDVPISKFSDDGEPQGTAGVPILEAIKTSKLENVIIIVTRYFGGTLLGTGGLIRAYTKTAKTAINEGKITIKKLYITARAEFDYPIFEKIKKLAKTKEYIITEVEYETQVMVSFAILYDEYDGFIEEINEIVGKNIGNIKRNIIWR